MIAAASVTQAFPRGVVDAGRNRAYLRDPSGYLVALDTTTGKILWRAEAVCRPLCMHGEKLVAVGVEPPNVLKVICLNVDNGHVSLSSNPLPFPDWVKIALEDTADFSLHCESEADSVVLYWSAHARYRGGAAPSAKVLQAAQRDDSGRFRINLATGQSEMITQTETAASTPPAEDFLASLEPEVLEQRIIGDICYQVLARESAGIVRTIVKALRTQDDRTLWETIIGETAARRPRPLRP